MAIELTAPPGARPDARPIQRRTLRLLFVTQIIGGIGVTIGISVGALLARRVAGTAVSGLASACGVVGAALLAVPVTRLMTARGRRPGLVLAYLTGAAGGTLVVVAAVYRLVPLLFVGMLLFGGGTAAGLQARYTAVDLAEPARRARQLSLVVWATTIGAVAAPNFATVADASTRRLGLPPYAGPFAFSAAAFVLTAALLLVLLRPDPLLTARRLAATDPPPPVLVPSGAESSGATGPSDTVPAAVESSAAVSSVAESSAGGASGVGAGSPSGAVPGRRSGRGLREALRVVAARPAARLGVAAVAVGHLVMVAVMTMTPVRIGETHGEADVLRVVGLVLSLHIAGMYALSPLVGWLADRLGRRAVILGAMAVLLAACAVAGTAGHHTPRLAVGLVLLGLGWSGTMVAGSTLLSESVPADVRPAAQGLTDLTMGLAGASAGAASGFVVQFAGYPVLTGLAAVAVVPLLALALRPVPASAPAGA